MTEEEIKDIVVPKHWLFKDFKKPIFLLRDAMCLLVTKSSKQLQTWPKKEEGSA